MAERKPGVSVTVRCCVLFATLILLMLLAMSVGGCAVGRGPTGEVVWGWKVGEMAETAEQALGAAVNTIAPGAGTLIATLLGSTGLAAAGTAWINRHVAKTAAEAERLRGREEGWNQAVLEGAVRQTGAAS